jgi:hypothetical protein
MTLLERVRQWYHFQCLIPSTDRREERSGLLKRFLVVRAYFYAARLLAPFNEALYSTFVNSFFNQRKSASDCKFGK